MRLPLRRFLSIFVFFTAGMACASPQSDVAINQLIDGLHQDAAEARFDSYFGRFSSDAVFMGTDRSERWSIAEFKAYAKPIFDVGQGWRYEVVERNLSGVTDIRWFDEILFNQKYGYCRGTGVVRRTGDGWEIANYSLTFLVPNEAASSVGKLIMSADSLAPNSH